MNTFDPILDQLTKRLRLDPELQRDVRLELASHLQDAAAEHAAAGLSPQDSQSAALKDLGDQNDLADRLWQANRRRVKLRFWAKLAAQTTLVPAAIALAIFLALDSFRAFAFYSLFSSNGQSAPMI